MQGSGQREIWRGKMYSVCVCLWEWYRIQTVLVINESNNEEEGSNINASQSNIINRWSQMYNANTQNTCLAFLLALCCAADEAIFYDNAVGPNDNSLKK